MATGGILGTSLLADDETGATASGDELLDPFTGDRVVSDYNVGQTGVFGLHPLMTPKYAVNNGLRDNEFKETLARMFVSLSNTDQTTKNLYLRSLPKEDRVQALAKVLIGDNAGTGNGTGFIDFILSQANESFNEKIQIDEVLGDQYVAFYFGQQPPVFQYSGYLLNSRQDDQLTGFALAYQHLIRGSQLARRGALLRLRYNGVIVSGTINSMSSVLNAESELAVPFNFSLLVKEYAILRQPAFVKTSPADFVKLATEFDPDNILKSVGKIKDARIVTQMITPTLLAEESIAGSEDTDTPVDPSKPAPEQLQSKIDDAIKPNDVNSNVRA